MSDKVHIHYMSEVEVKARWWWPFHSYEERREAMLYPGLHHRCRRCNHVQLDV